MLGEATRSQIFCPGVTWSEPSVHGSGPFSTTCLWTSTTASRFTGAYSSSICSEFGFVKASVHISTFFISDALMCTTWNTQNYSFFLLLLGAMPLIAASVHCLPSILWHLCVGTYCFLSIWGLFKVSNFQRCHISRSDLLKLIWFKPFRRCKQTRLGKDDCAFRRLLWCVCWL